MKHLLLALLILWSAPHIADALGPVPAYLVVPAALLAIGALFANELCKP